jgi:nicotinate-nucleotide adenylyltransferase
MENVNKIRIGILGGSFNPIHIGHLLLAQSAVDSFDLDKVLFMPCNVQPLKGEMMLTSSEHRVAMIEEAIIDNLQFELLDIEIARGGRSYAIDSMREVHALYPDAEIFFIVGADTLSEFYRWHDIYSLLDLTKFAIFSRPGQNFDDFSSKKMKLDDPWPAKLLKNVAQGRMIDISSSDIRHRVAEGMSIGYLVPSLVEMYIAEHNLYQN